MKQHYGLCSALFFSLIERQLSYLGLYGLASYHDVDLLSGNSQGSLYHSHCDRRAHVRAVRAVGGHADQSAINHYLLVLSGDTSAGDPETDSLSGRGALCDKRFLSYEVLFVELYKKAKSASLGVMSAESSCP